MVNAFLNHCDNLGDCGKILKEILKFYGKEFNSKQMIITPSEIISQPIETSRPYGLIVKDVYLPSANAAASVTQFEQIALLFSSTYDKINQIAENYEGEPILDRIIKYSRVPFFHS